jgi:hypothetical protein
MDLPELNDRWKTIGKPYAKGDDTQLYRWYCPYCQREGVANVPLVAAMNDALVHKRDCTEVP